MATVQEVADAAGVAYSTASIALRGVGNVSEKTRKLVLEAAQRLGYRPNAAASVLAGQRRRTKMTEKGLSLAIFTHKELGDDVMYMKVFSEGLASADTRPSGFMRSEKELKGLAQRFWHGGGQGILLSAPTDWDDWNWQQIGLSRFSLMRRGRVLPNLPVAMIRVSSAEMIRMSVDAVFKRGYKRVWCVCRESDSEFDDDMRLAWLHYYRERYLPTDCELVWDRLGGSTWDDWDLGEIKSYIQDHAIDAVLAFPWSFYFKVLDAGFKVPEDIGFAGMPVHLNERDASIVSHSISGVDAMRYEQGRYAAHKLHSLIASGEYGIPETYDQILLEPKWVEGETLPCRQS